MINLTPRMDATFLDADPIFESYTVPVPGSGFVEKKISKRLDSDPYHWAGIS